MLFTCSRMKISTNVIAPTSYFWQSYRSQCVIVTSTATLHIEFFFLKILCDFGCEHRPGSIGIMMSITFGPLHYTDQLVRGTPHLPCLFFILLIFHVVDKYLIKYTNPARGILDFCKQKLAAPPLGSVTHLVHSHVDRQCPPLPHYPPQQCRGSAALFPHWITTDQHSISMKCNIRAPLYCTCFVVLNKVAIYIWK